MNGIGIVCDLEMEERGGVECALGGAAAGHDAKLEIVHQVGADVFGEIREDMAGEGEEIALPDLIFHFNDQAGANELHGAGILGQTFADGARPGAQDDLFGGDGRFRDL